MGQIQPMASPPFTGCIYYCARSKSGRLWLVDRIVRWHQRDRRFPEAWHLEPIGWDVQPAQEHGKFNGGVRGITVEHTKLMNPSRRSSWRLATYEMCQREGVTQPSNVPDFMLRG